MEEKKKEGHTWAVMENTKACHGKAVLIHKMSGSKHIKVVQHTRPRFTGVTIETKKFRLQISSVFCPCTGHSDEYVADAGRETSTHKLERTTNKTALTPNTLEDMHHSGGPQTAVSKKQACCKAKYDSIKQSKQLDYLLMTRCATTLNQYNGQRKKKLKKRRANGDSGAN